MTETQEFSYRLVPHGDKHIYVEAHAYIGAKAVTLSITDDTNMAVIMLTRNQASSLGDALQTIVQKINEASF